MPHPLLTSVHSPFNLIQSFKDRVHQSKTDFILVYACMFPFLRTKNKPISVCIYICSANGILRVFTILKGAAHACRKNLRIPATIS